MLGYAVYNVGKWQQWWGNNLPVPGEQNVTLSLESATLRYVVGSDRVEYYTGTNWEGFSGKNIDIGDKRISNDVLKKNFKDYFYASRGPERMRIEADGQNILYGKGYEAVVYFDAVFVGVLKEVGTTGPYSNGNVYVEFKNRDVSDPNVYGQFISNLRGQVYFNRINTPTDLARGKYVEQDASISVYRDLAAKAEKYRDLVLKKPVSLTVGRLQSGKEVEKVTQKYCVEKVVYEGEISLVARLENFVSKEEC